MKNNFKQYEAMLKTAAETADACLDMEGGAFFLSWTGELLQELTAAGRLESATFAAKKLCEAVGVETRWTEYDGLDRDKKRTWLELFAGALMDHVSISAG